MKKESSPSTHASIMTRVFPGSWFSRFKQKGSNPDAQNSVSKKQRGKLDFPSSYSILRTPGWKEGKFYVLDDEEDDLDDNAYWRLSFHGDRIEGSESTGGNGIGVNFLWEDDSEDESRLPRREMEIPKREQHQSVINRKKKKKEKHRFQYEDSVQSQNGAFIRQKPNGEAEFSARRKKDENGRFLKKGSRKVVKRREAGSARGIHDGKANPTNPEERDTFATESKNMERKAELPDSAIAASGAQQNLSFSNSSPSSAEEGPAFADLNGDESNSTPERASILDRQIFEGNKSKAARIQRKSASTRRQSRGRKLKQNQGKAYSPQTEVGIRVLKDMKNARMKLNKERKAQVVPGRTIFDSFAVIKTSTNPWQDFRDSMLEMINEKGIRRPEELQELLASYLTLNSDGHHNLIIKVFLEVCFELNEDHAHLS